MLKEVFGAEGKCQIDIYDLTKEMKKGKKMVCM